MVAVALLQDWSYRIDELHTVFILSFAQMVLPISAAAKGVLWTVLFGLAKTCQYGGLTILGVEGYKRFKNMLKRN